MPTTHRRFVFTACLAFLLSALLTLPVSAQKSPCTTGKTTAPRRNRRDCGDNGRHSSAECQGTCWSAEWGLWSSDEAAVSPSVEVKDGGEARTFTLPEYAGATEPAGADRSALDAALGVMGLPGVSADGKDDSVYDRARKMQSGQQSYGERYRRNPDGSYGGPSSSRLRGNVADQLLEQALSAGGGYFSSWAEGRLGGYGNARIRLRINDRGDVTGAGDFLLPLYDSEFSTFFTQMGLRTMSGDRVIGNFGLGQRFFPGENFAFGYNAFIDQDFSRNHTRGGVGLEAWHDWLRLSTNYYTPLSGWKDSEDYDSRLVEERPAEGFDARLTGYLPFYRNLAVTGAFEKWMGGHVGAFGRDDLLNKNPEVWSYGLEWTPVPILSASVNQRHSGGHDETQFGLTFNYHFDMPWEDQISSATVADLRTVEGSRHEFVSRQNEMVLEYQAKAGVFNIIQRGSDGTNIFLFQITNGFGEPAAGQVVRVSGLPAGVVLNSPDGVYTTDGNGLIRIGLVTVPASASLPVMATLSVGKTSRSFPLGASVTGSLILTPTNGLTFVTPSDPGYTADVAGYQSTASVLVQFDDNSGSGPQAVTEAVSWSVVSVDTPSGAWWKRSGSNNTHGLAWGDDFTDSTPESPELVLNMASGSQTTSTAKLTDIVGSRSAILKASVTIGGTLYEGTTTVAFGDGPLSVFSGAIGGGEAWSTQYFLSGFTSASGTDGNVFKAPVGICGGTVYNGSTQINSSTGVITQDGTYWRAGEVGGSYSPQTNLPKVSQLLAVAAYDSNYNAGVQRKGAAFAAGWSVGSYNYSWAGEVKYITHITPTEPSAFFARVVDLEDGQDDWDYVHNALPVAVCLRP